jgi:nanoRNase/pAp phosphatase (c-di-AMP/oligoRNAs hydrolase)
LIPDIEAKKHIVLLCDSNSFGVASALYTYMLMEHKKVSLVGEVERKFSFLPWFDALRKQEPASADLLIDTREIAVHKLYSFFVAEGIKINAKMATSLYCAYFLEYKHFTSAECDGMVFAALSKIVELGAAYEMVQKALLYNQPLKLFRLRGYLCQEMQLVENATKALVYFDEMILQKSGAEYSDLEALLEEFLTIAHVEEVLLLKRDENNKIMKKLKDESIEKK